MLPNNRVKHLLRQGLCLVVFSMICASQAQEGADDKTAQTPPVPVVQGKTAPVPTKETFTPTEDISEDLAVSFPVDI